MLSVPQLDALAAKDSLTYEAVRKIAALAIPVITPVNASGAVALQEDSPGTIQTGNINVDGIVQGEALDLTQGAAVAVSDDNEARVRYNQTNGFLEVSFDQAAYVPLGTGYAGTMRGVISPDPNLALGTFYEKGGIKSGLNTETDLLLIKPQRTWIQVIADAKANVPAGWTWVNSATLTSSDENTTVANGLDLNGVGGGTTYDYTSAGVSSSPQLYKLMPGGLHGYEIIARCTFSNLSTGNACGIYMERTGTNDRMRIEVVGTTIYSSDAGGATNTAAITPTQRNQGIWLRMVRDGAANTCTTYYSLTNQATPPTDWTAYRNCAGFFTGATATLNDDIRSGIILVRTDAGNASRGTVLYFENRFQGIPAHIGIKDSADGWSCTGYDNSNPSITLVASYDLGSPSAAIADATLQAVLTECTNPRSIDTAVWTYSAVRGAAANPAAGSYTSAATTTVVGTGQYFALYAKCSSTGRVLPGSLNISRLQIPFTSVFAYSANSVLLQSSTPGSQQTGNANITGTLGLGVTGTIPTKLTVSENTTALPANPQAGTVIHAAAADAAATRILVDSFGATTAFTGRRANTSAASPSGVVADDVLTQLTGIGYTSAGAYSASRADVQLRAAETWSGTIQGAYALIRTALKGTTTLAEKFRVADDGKLTQTMLSLALVTPGVMFTQTADATTTANALTTLFGTGVGTLTLPVNLLIAGRTIRLTLGGYVTAATAAGTHTLTLLLGGVTVATGASLAVLTSTVNAGWSASALITCRTTGAGGTVVGGGGFRFAAAAVEDVALAAATGTAAADTTATLAIDLKLNNGAAVGTYRTQYAVVEILN